MPDVSVSITQVQKGHVIGKGGSTLKGIEERTGAKLEIIEDGPAVRISADDDAAIAAAEAEVRKIVDAQENPDYEGPEGALLRKEANALGDKRSQLFDEATKLREAGDHDGANKLVAEAKQSGEEMQARHQAAAAAIAKYNNEAKGKGEDFFDMHGLREEEAVAELKVRVAKLEAKPAGTVTDFEVVPGAGHHSAPGAQKLMGATEAYFKEKGYAYEPINAGSLMVKVPGSGADAAAKPEANDCVEPAKADADVAKPAATKTTEEGEEAACPAKTEDAAALSKKPAAASEPTEEETSKPEKIEEEKKSKSEKKKEEKNKSDKKEKSKSCCACM